MLRRPPPPAPLSPPSSPRALHQDKIEWRKKYRKYKPLKQPAVCTCCHQKTVKAAYHKACRPCAEEKGACPWCLKSWKEIRAAEQAHNREQRAKEEEARSEAGAEDEGEDEGNEEEDGLELAGCEVALEVQSPWAGRILDGTKTIETRRYPLPEALLGRAVWILESLEGDTGVSGLPDSVPLQRTAGGPVVVGKVVFGSCDLYDSPEAFAQDEEHHLVGKDSPYNWSEDAPLYGWTVQHAERMEWHAAEAKQLDGEEGEEEEESLQPSAFRAAKRVHRSIFRLELEAPQAADEDEREDGDGE